MTRVTALGLAGFALAALTTLSLGQPLTVGVPNVIGQTYEQALCILELHGLRISQEVFAPRAVSGQPVVVAQDPASPAQAERGTAVQVRMGLSDRPPSLVAVPPIPPRTPVVRARVALQRRDLCVVITPPAAGNLPNTLVVDALLLPSKRPIPEAVPRGATILLIAAIEVPDVVGRSVHDAVDALNGAGLSVGTVAPAASSGPPGVVASQSVSAGTLVVPPLPSVDLTESAVAVPSVTGRGLEDAAQVVREAGLTIGAVSPAAAPAPPGTITGQTPAAGTLVVPPLPAIDVTVSAVVMPDVVGQSLDAATHVLADTGVKVGRWAPAVSVKERGTVIDQDPAAGKLLSPPFPAAGLTIAAVQAPNVVGQSPTAARATLAEAGLGAGMPRWSGLPLATVSGQDPPAGVLITEAGAVVALTVDVSAFQNLSALFTALILAAGVIAGWNAARARSSIRPHVDVRNEQDGRGAAGIYVDGTPVRDGSNLIADPSVQLRLIPDPGVQSLTPTDVLGVEEEGRRG